MSERNIHFGVGDVVRLNSSSTRMTVDKIDRENEEGEVVCIWFDDGKDLKSAAFHIHQLVLVRAAQEE
jgi:uncharacterized protein YodC (DUF2158 family)